MEKPYKVVIDLLGSDKGPEEIIEGARLALESFPNVNVILVGPEELIKNANLPEGRFEIIPSETTITNLDNAAESFYQKKDASIFRAFAEAGRNDDVIGVINAGNTGAVLVSAVRYLLDENRTRPCLAAVLPTIKGGFTCIVDTGASIDCGSSQLVEFAHLGSEFMKRLYKLEAPRVALLSNGAEPTKGNKLVKETHHLLIEDTTINFVGNIEANKALSGDCDVIVTEGFAGNQVLKASEGMATNLITDIVKFGKATNNPAAMEIVGYLMKKYDFASLGAGIVLGSKKTILKCRGSSDRTSIKNSIHMLLNMMENKTFYEE